MPSNRVRDRNKSLLNIARRAYSASMESNHPATHQFASNVGVIGELLPDFEGYDVSDTRIDLGAFGRREQALCQLSRNKFIARRLRKAGAQPGETFLELGCGGGWSVLRWLPRDATSRELTAICSGWPRRHSGRHRPDSSSRICISASMVWELAVSRRPIRRHRTPRRPERRTPIRMPHHSTRGLARGKRAGADGPLERGR